ncbi:NAD(P)-dependent oxidoreductase [Geovibrio thiophilus]|uniref:NAD(P)-dependent oxidoreductase n=1 Tax=Geovibrio thiophilus TaxID=139438 RepID=A0A3R5UYP4_9BACT|nr:NAD(P)H-binding protein [Geovibrio thiophilus]QAR33710.1 NAD(P)-dependent oxidoreductase [Geovibrio thiophilus]
MKIAVIGAAGKAGSKIAAEAKARGHAVTAVVRNRAKLADKSLNVIEKDLFKLTAEELGGFDAVVNAFADFTAEENLFLKSAEHLVGETKKSGKQPYLFFVGGAGTLMVDGKEIYTLPDFPAAYYPVASKMAKAIEYLQTVSDVNWIFLSPSAEFIDGEKKGAFRIGGDELLVDKDGNSSITTGDYATAVLDELEAPKHIRKRFTVGY